MTTPNLQYDPKTDRINQLTCHPEEWEETSDWGMCPHCANHMNLVKGWDEDCNDYAYRRCPMCGWTEGEE